MIFISYMKIGSLVRRNIIGINYNENRQHSMLPSLSLLFLKCDWPSAYLGSFLLFHHQYLPTVTLANQGQTEYLTEEKYSFVTAFDIG